MVFPQLSAGYRPSNYLGKMRLSLYKQARAWDVKHLLSLMSNCSHCFCQQIVHLRGLFTSEISLPALVFLGWHLQLAPAPADSCGQRCSLLRSLFGNVVLHPNIWVITSSTEINQGQGSKLRRRPSSVSGPRNMPDLLHLALPCTEYTFEWSLISSISFAILVPSQFIVSKNQNIYWKNKNH